MRSTSSLFIAFSVTFGLSLSTAAFAESGVGGEVSVTSSVSAKEKVDFSSDALAEMDDAGKRAEKLLDVAERTGDAEMIQCVRRHLASIRTLREVSEFARTTMIEAIASGEDVRADFEFRKIAVSVSKVRQFIAEAEACLGETGSADQQTSVDVASEGVADADDTEPITGDLGTIGVDPPGISPLE